MTIAHVLAARNQSAVLTAAADMTVHQVATILAEHRIGAVPVMEGERIAGIFSERDVLYCLAKGGASALDRPVCEVMTSPAITVSPETTILEALSLMTRRRIRHLPVTTADAMIGLVSIGDLVKHRIDSIEREAEAMRSYIQAV
ncbi:MAG: CBS domain-containing protein [Sphingomonadales bacterium]|nr:CBS domain-containing protein [Sphingomonadales bacterium]MBU3992428.1 CBS domain-containing protein [Alphaproteobacteria bacterium]